MRKKKVNNDTFFSENSLYSFNNSKSSCNKTPSNCCDASLDISFSGKEDSVFLFSQCYIINWCIYTLNTAPWYTCTASEVNGSKSTSGLKLWLLALIMMWHRLYSPQASYSVLNVCLLYVCVWLSANVTGLCVLVFAQQTALPIFSGLIFFSCLQIKTL